MDTTVLVTGASGFIGTWTVRELLSRGVGVVGLDAQRAPERWARILGAEEQRVAWTDASLLDRDALQAAMEAHAVTHVIHLAALLTPACQEDPWRGCQVNVLGSTSVFDAARRCGTVRGISYASSYAVYGEAADVADDRPPMFYGAFKLAVDDIAHQYWRHFRLRSVAVRPHVVYGPERDQGLTAGPSLACRAAARGEPYGIGYTGRVGYDYVEDVARAFVRSALECPEGARAVDLPGERATTEEFVRSILAANPAAQIRVDGPEIPSNVPSHPRYITELFPDWRAIPLTDGVRRTIDFYRLPAGGRSLDGGAG